MCAFEALVDDMAEADDPKKCGVQECNLPADFRCTKCKAQRYCGKKHQAEHWPQHKRICAMVSHAKNAASWAAGMPTAAQYEWLLDCYRMRVDDDMVYGRSCHGLYDPDHDEMVILRDFLIFCKLAVKASAVPQPWDWATFLAMAAQLLPYAFEKSDAQDKYGGENIFRAQMGGRSLRYTAGMIYGFTAVDMLPDSEQTKSHDEMSDAVHDRANSASAPLPDELFADVGGSALWSKLRSGLKASLARR